MLSAAFTGTVLFSMIILWPSLTAELIDLAADSMYFKSAARPCKLQQGLGSLPARIRFAASKD